MGMLSIIIPSANEPYLFKTIQDILVKATQSIEVIAILDGYWLKPEEVIDDKRIRYIHFETQRGMRNAINAGVAIAKGEFILKCDAHVMFAKGFDEVLTRDCKDNQVLVPRRYALDPVKWEIVNNPKYPVDYMYLDKEMHGVIWEEKNKDPKLKDRKIDELMSAQGSCWVMKKSYYEMLRILDEENYGTFFNEFQEIGLKTWLYQGRVLVDKNTWYAHWHKTESRGYSLNQGEQEKARAYTNKWFNNMAWVAQQRQPLSWLIKRFWPVPTWSEEYIKQAEKDGEVMFWRKWLAGDRGARHLKIRPLVKHIVEMTGDKKEVSIADLGSGPVSTIGYTLEGVKVNYVPSDLLAEEYKELYKYHNLIPPVYPEYQDMTNLTYQDESFDIVHCRNAIDHCPDTYKAIKEMYRICKKGGYIYLWHFKNVGKMMGYTGMHQWNIELTKDGDCSFYNKDKHFLLSECVPGFVNSEILLSHTVIVNKLQK